MMARRLVETAFGRIAVVALSYGCSSVTAGVTTPPVNDGGSDGPPICEPNKSLVTIPWAPPTPFRQGACSSAQIALYETDFAGDNTPAFRADPKNATCVACIETNASAPKHGPVVLGGIFQTNYGGCVANVEGATGSSGCGPLIDAYQACAYQECGDCADYSIGGTETVSCLKQAIGAGGKCAPYWSSQTQSCGNELTMGSTSICKALPDFLDLWCGPNSASDGGSPDGSTTDGSTTDGSFADGASSD